MLSQLDAAQRGQQIAQEELQVRAEPQNIRIPDAFRVCDAGFLRVPVDVVRCPHE